MHIKLHKQKHIYDSSNYNRINYNINNNNNLLLKKRSVRDSGKQVFNHNFFAFMQLPEKYEDFSNARCTYYIDLLVASDSTVTNTNTGFSLINPHSLCNCNAMQSTILPWQVVPLHVCLSVCNVEVLWSHRLEYFEYNFTVD